MSLKYENLSDIEIKKDDFINISLVNQKFEKLIENDKTLVYSSKAEPQIWECKWWNNNNINGYSEGDAIWYNTEDPNIFLLNKADNIYEYVKNDSSFASWIQPFNPDDESSVSTYYSLMTGYVDIERQIKRSAIYDIGNIQDKVQLKISLIDNNKYPLSNSAYWKNYFIEISDIIENINDIASLNLSTHIKDYHLENKNINLDNYVLKTFNNITKFQKLGTHNCDIHKDDREGFDYIFKHYKLNSFDQQYSISKLSSYTSLSTYIYYNAIDTNKIDGIYYLNNYIPATEINSKLSDVINFSTIQSFLPTLADNFTLGNIEFRLSGGSGNEFPFRFKYTEDYYSKVQNQLTNYFVQFLIAEISSTTKPDESLIGYYTFKKNYPISTDQISDIQGQEDNYTSVEEIHEISKNDSYDIEYNIITSWVKYWSSGYLEQGGVIELPTVYEPTLLTIYLSQPYEYTETKKSFYSSYNKFDDINTYEQEDNLKKEKRYIINITPVSNSFNRSSKVEIVKIENRSFSIIVNDTSPDYIQYQTIGIISK